TPPGESARICQFRRGGGDGKRNRVASRKSKGEQDGEPGAGQPAPSLLPPRDNDLWTPRPESCRRPELADLLLRRPGWHWCWPGDAKIASLTRSGPPTPEERRFWSFQPVKEPPVPAVQDASWPLTPIDRFVLTRLEKEGLKPVGAADRRTLLRRVTFDLTGLP